MRKPHERRISRSVDPLVALSRSFEASRRRWGIETLVLADDSGFTIAAAGPAARCDVLAAECAVLSAQHAANDTVPCRLDVVTRGLAVRRLRIDGIEVLLCAEGNRPSTEESLSEAAMASSRILEASRPRGGSHGRI